MLLKMFFEWTFFKKKKEKKKELSLQINKCHDA